MRQLNRRGAFTMIQLLVLLALLAFALALALPFLARARSAAAQAQSQNNLRQIGIAMHSYHDANRLFPPALGVTAQAEGTMFFFLLPYVEQDNIYQKAAGKVWLNGTYSTPINAYLNPQDASAPPENRYKGWLATCSYAASWPLLKDKGALITDITDGTSNTIGAVERYQMCNGHPNGWGYPSMYYWAPIFGYYSKARFQLAPPQERCNPALPQSVDANGINIVLCDGSSRMISDGCSPSTWWLAVDPADNNPIGDDFQ